MPAFADYLMHLNFLGLQLTFLGVHRYAVLSVLIKEKQVAQGGAVFSFRCKFKSDNPASVELVPGFIARQYLEFVQSLPMRALSWIVTVTPTSRTEKSH